jgi:hypothetical protein
VKVVEVVLEVVLLIMPVLLNEMLLLILLKIVAVETAGDSHCCDCWVAHLRRTCAELCDQDSVLCSGI